MILHPKDIIKILRRKRSYCYKLARTIKDSTGKMFVTLEDFKDITGLSEDEIRNALKE